MEYNTFGNRVSYGQLLEQVRKDGFEHIPEWNKWKLKQKQQKIKQEWLNNLEKKYGKEFAELARQNKIRKCVLDTGCKTESEYSYKCAQNRGFKNRAERVRNWTHETGRNLPKEFNEDCPRRFGEFISQNYVMKTFEDPVPMSPNNRWYDWTCKKGEKIEHKSACLVYGKYGSISWSFQKINFNPIADYFILSAWDNRNSLTPMHVWIFHRNDLVRGKPFWMRNNFKITNKSKYLEEFKDYKVTDRLEKLKELC